MVGGIEGNGVGIWEGKWELVGLVEGPRLGVLDVVGSNDGTFEGCEVGDMDGTNEGGIDGESEGRGLGTVLTVGSGVLVGEFVGSPVEVGASLLVGCIVGDRVGYADGGKDGILVWVGEWVG